jgi:hypothetical protein
VHGPRPNLGIFMLKDFQQVRNGLLEKEVVENLAATHDNRWIRVMQSVSHKSARCGSGSHEVSQGSLRPVVYSQVLNVQREVVHNDI